MVEQFAAVARPVLDLPLVRRTRRNHGLEHATITILSQRIKSLQMAGRSDAGGFVLLGEVDTEQVERAVQDALRRMRAGERQLAVHPNCGTNLVTTSLLTSLTTMAGMAGTKDSKGAFNRLPLVMAMGMVAILFSQPLGLAFQKHLTTDGDPADLEVIRIKRREVRAPMGGMMTVHRVDTRSS